MLEIHHDTDGDPQLDVLLDSCPWEEVSEYVGQRHRPILALIPDSDQFRGIYWDASRGSVGATADLGSEPRDAARRFRDLLNSPEFYGQTPNAEVPPPS